jgi:DNA invertase Pin-like site-specific DNA recombinase
MSTEHQQYSLENQSSAIARYAEEHGFVVVCTYADAARSGLVLKRRTGLQQLLQDVVASKGGYRAVLVYDISRWGRFQDMDESAHYEFMCRQAGIQVLYVAETFTNDGSVSSSIMKALKRSMAGEYSRELSVKVLAGQERLARLGFKQGGVPGYGLRRMLVAADGTPKQKLNYGERKSISTDRVILVPGPENEIECVRMIFSLLIEKHMKVKAIARELNNRAIPYIDAFKWRYGNVFNILTHPKYVGTNVYGRYTQKLHTPAVPNPPECWILAPGAFQPIIDIRTFNSAQQILRSRNHHKSNEEILAGLRRLLVSHGKLSRKLIENSRLGHPYSTIRGRFGTIKHAYELVGYENPDTRQREEHAKRAAILRNAVLAELVAASGGSIKIIGGERGTKTKLRLPNRRIVSVLICHSYRSYGGRRAWRVRPTRTEHPYVRLLVLLNKGNDAVEQMRAVWRIKTRKRFCLLPGDRLFKASQKLKSAADLIKAVRRAKGAVCNASD